jgi:hypothetical protein
MPGPTTSCGCTSARGAPGPVCKRRSSTGTGRQISDTDREVLLCCGAITAVWLVVRAHEYGDSGFEEASRRNLQRLKAADGDR